MRYRILVLMLISASLSSCYDNVSENHKTYQDAVNSNLNTRGWLPLDVIPKTATDISLTNNLDINTSTGGFQLDQASLSDFKSKLNYDETNTVYVYSKGSSVWSFRINEKTAYVQYSLK